MEREGDGPCADHEEYDVSCDIGDMVGKIGADRFLTPRKLGRFDIGPVIPDYPIQEGRGGIPQDPLRGVADSLRNVPPADRVTEVPEREQIDINVHYNGPYRLRAEDLVSEQMANDGLALGPSRLLKKRPERRFKVPPPEASE